MGITDNVDKIGSPVPVPIGRPPVPVPVAPVGYPSVPLPETGYGAEDKGATLTGAQEPAPATVTVSVVD